MQCQLIAQGPADGATLAIAFAEAISDHRFDRLDVAVAYATLQGIRTLERALSGFRHTSRWVIGLDDGITQPEAIDDLLTQKHAEVRLVSMAPARRFHPKLYCSWSSDHGDRCVTAIGSGNMTLNGLLNNAETAVLLTAESCREVSDLRAQWQTMWDMGTVATPDRIGSYRELYRTARRQRSRIADLGIAPREPEPDMPVQLQPNDVRLAWLEAGSPSAGGRDLEFPRAIMPFFQLTASPVLRRFRMKNGQVFPLTFTERRDNQMWRLLFSRDAIRAAMNRESLRPTTGGNRSDLAISFRKSSGGADYDIQMTVIGSPEHQRLIARSRAVLALRRTRDPGGRQFGFA